MSASKSGDVLMRQWHLLKLIPASGKGITVADLHQGLLDAGFDQNIRTTQRNLRDLSIVFPITTDEDQSPPQWFWMKGASLDIPNLSVPDALSIKMMQDYLTPLLPQAMVQALQSRFKQAETRLESINNQFKRWPQKIRTVSPGQPLLAPVIAEGVLEGIQTALIEERQIKAHYHGRYTQETTEYVLHPLALVQRGPVSYLVATAFSYEDVRLYALHRFASVEVTEDEAEIPKSFDIDEYIRTGGLSFGSGEAFQLKLRVQSDLRTTLVESPLSTDMTITPDGDLVYLVSATVQDTWQLKWWIRSQGAQVEVLEPKSLREEFRETLRQTLAMYED